VVAGKFESAKSAQFRFKYLVQFEAVFALHEFRNPSSEALITSASPQTHRSRGHN
jgi:hypothetical protein